MTEQLILALEELVFALMVWSAARGAFPPAHGARLVDSRGFRRPCEERRDEAIQTELWIASQG